MAVASHGVAVESKTTRRDAGKRRFSGELICSSRRVEGEAREAVGVASSSPAVKIFTGRYLSDGHGARITASGNQRRRATGSEGSRAGSLIWFRLLYHQSDHQTT